MVKKAITHLKLDQANPGKLHKLDELAAEHQRVVQAYVDWLIAHEVRQPDKYADIPEQDVPTPLSDRWQRCAWQQACGIVQSWYSNERENPPVLHNVCIQANTNVVSSSLPTRRSSISGCGFPHWMPGIRCAYRSSYMSGPEKRWPNSQSCAAGVTLNRRDGEWYATFVVERKGPKPNRQRWLEWTSAWSRSCLLRMAGVMVRSVQNCAVGWNVRNAKRRRKQQLNACLKRKNQPTVSLNDDKAEAFARNEIGRALNQMLDELPGGRQGGAGTADGQRHALQVQADEPGSCALRSWGTCETSSNSSWTSAVFAIARCNQLIPANSVPNVGLPFR